MKDTEKTNQDSFRKALKEITKEIEKYPSNLQKIHTPFSLCNCIINRLKEYDDFEDKDFCVFNLEFIDVLYYDFGVSLSKIWFVTDSKEKVAIAKSSRYQGVNVMKKDLFEILKNKSEGKKFDVILMNPPYHAPINRKAEDKSRGNRTTLWQKFVKVAFFNLKEGGYLCAIHPPRWRKPKDECGDLLRSKNILYLEMHSKEDGLKTFGCGTKYDWYIVRNSENYNGTFVLCEDKTAISNFNIRESPFIPNKNMALILSLIAKPNEPRCQISYSYSAYETRKAWMSEKKHDDYQFPCIHTTGKKQTRMYYSCHKNNGMFNIPKVIFGDGGGDGITNPVIDMNGEYGLTQHAIGIHVDSQQEAKNIVKAITSEKFRTLFLHSCLWTNFEIEHETFMYLRKDFWKEFVDEK
jgi:hypothetical protein